MSEHESLVDYVNEHVLPYVKGLLLKRLALANLESPHHLVLIAAYHKDKELIAFHLKLPDEECGFSIAQDEAEYFNSHMITDRYASLLESRYEEFTIEPL